MEIYPRTAAERAKKLQTLVCNVEAADAIFTRECQSPEWIDATHFPDVD